MGVSQYKMTLFTTDGCKVSNEDTIYIHSEYTFLYSAKEEALQEYLIEKKITEGTIVKTTVTKYFEDLMQTIQELRMYEN